MEGVVAYAAGTSNMPILLQGFSCINGARLVRVFIVLYAISTVCSAWAGFCSCIEYLLGDTGTDYHSMFRQIYKRKACGFG